MRPESSFPAQPHAPPIGLVIDRSDLSVRLALARPDDTAKGMFFNGALSAIRRFADVPTAEVCREASGEKKFVDFFSYPISGFLNLSFTAARLLDGKMGGYEEVFRRLGRQAVDDFLSTAVGKTLLVLAGKDPRRLLSTLPPAYKTAVSYGERKADFVGDKHCVFTVKRDFMPHPYHEGVLEQVITAMGVATVSVRGTRLGPVDASYDIQWS